MPRTFSPSIQGELDRQFAGEPMVIVEVNWSGDSFVAYSDRKLNDENYPHPYLISIGTFDTTTTLTGGSDSQSVSMSLNDIDGSLRGIIDTQDVHLRPVRVYLTFQGLALTEKALMFEGLINSPIEWDESGRSLSFSVLSKLEDAEAGFTMEDGDFPYVPPSEANKPWPLVFGQVCNMEAVRVSALRKGFLAQGIGVMDPTIDERLCQAQHLKCAKKISYEPKELSAEQQKIKTIQLNQFLNSSGMIQLSFCCGGDLTNYNAAKQKFIDGQNKNDNIRKEEPDKACLQKRFSEICQILQERSQQSQYVLNPFTVRGGEDFPQDESITIKIGDVTFTGVMTGESFQVSSTHHPALDDIDNPVCRDIKDASLGWRYGPEDDLLPTNLEQCLNGGGQYKEDVVDGSGESWRYYNTFEAGDFIWLPAGTDVFLDAESELVHIVSLLPGVVDQVAAYRTYGDTTLLTEVDPDNYTVHTVDYGGYDVVELHLPKLLSNIANENWDDEIYVSFTSSIGPNPVDTITWLVEKYTSYTIDATSFAAVHADLVNYPSNFFRKSRPTVLSLIADIAYQARCAVYVRDNVIYLTYLPREPSSLVTLTEDDIIHQSFSFHHTVTEDLKTRNEVKWSNGEAGVTKDDATEFDFVLKHNIPKYGNFDATWDYYTQNTFSTVEKSATFWMIRNSNTWRKVKFSTPVKFLNLDVFDCVTLNIAQFPTTKVIIETAQYQIGSNTIAFEAWTPVLSGTSTPYYWAWPSQQAVEAVWPLPGEDGTSGDGFSFSVVPPIGSPLRGGYDPDVAEIPTDGDKHPSDLDDVFPTLSCPLATGAEIADDIEPVIRILEPFANANFADDLDDKAAGDLGGGGGGGSDDDKETKVCGKENVGSGGCMYEVHVTYIQPDLQQGGPLPRGGGSCGGGPCGKNINSSTPCTGGTSTQCHSFGALFAAQAFRAGKHAEIKALKENCGYNYMQWAPYSTGWLPINAVAGSGPYGECQELPGEEGDPTAPGAQDGEVTQMSPMPGSPPIAEYLAAQADLAIEEANPGTNNNPGDAI